MVATSQEARHVKTFHSLNRFSMGNDLKIGRLESSATKRNSSDRFSKDLEFDSVCPNKKLSLVEYSS